MVDLAYVDRVYSSGAAPLTVRGYDVERQMDWNLLELEFDEPDTVQARLTNGKHEILLLAELTLNGRQAVLRKLHIEGAGANTMGLGALRRLMKWAKKHLDVDHLRIEGATRTSGASPGRDPH